MGKVVDSDKPRREFSNVAVIFSIIIPIYNIQDYIVSCLDSIEKQITPRCEVILVDDGSTDQSGKICDDYALKHTNFWVYHISNSGPSAARNFGVEKAKGFYLVFVDGDDYLKEKAFLSWENDLLRYGYPDVLLESGEYYDKNGSLELSKRLNGYGDVVRTGSEALKVLLKGKPLWAPFGKCFKADFWNKEGFKFREGMISEDLELVYKVIYRASSVAVASSITYCYRYRRKGSLMENFNKKDILDLFTVMEDWEIFFRENHVETEIVNGMRKEFGNMLRYYVLFRLAGLGDGAKRELEPFIKKRLRYLLYCKNFHLYLIGRICGINRLFALCKAYLKMKQKIIMKE